jgi:hypothetical protein
VLGTNAREGRQGLVAQERVFHAGLGSGVCSFYGLTGRSGSPNEGDPGRHASPM